MEDQARFKTRAKPTWCPGCGNFGIQNALMKALLSLDLAPHEVMMASGIGCSGKISQWIKVNGFHGLHGRALPAATGMKLANHNMVVLAEGGDGDGYSEGLSHFIHACRRNLDITYIVHNNGVYGLTTGQVSPTGNQGFVSSTTPFGAVERPFRPLALAISAGANYVARGFSGELGQLAGLIAEGIKRKGFSFIDVFQVCVTFNPTKSYQWYRDVIYNLEDEDHQATDRAQALAVALQDDERLATGVFYRGSAPTHEELLPQLGGVPLVERDIMKVNIDELIEETI